MKLLEPETIWPAERPGAFSTTTQPDLHVIRVATVNGSRVLQLRTGFDSIDIVVSPAGHKIRVYRDGEELR